MRAHAVYLKMTDKMRQNMADSFSKGTFCLLLTRLDSTYIHEVGDMSCTVANYDRQANFEPDFEGESQ